MSYKIAGVVVLYNPDDGLISNVDSYIDGIDVLFAVDNSDKANEDRLVMLKNKPKVVYIKNPSNLGIAEALNIGALAAIGQSFDFILTMDQDSGFKANDFFELLKLLNGLDVNEVGILSPVHNTNEVSLATETLIEVPLTMTSGNLLNLFAFQKIGPFDATLFIDHVDHEYCFRLRRNGYKVLKATKVVLNHNLGTLRKINFAGIKQLQFVSHSPVRTYYMIRNGLIVAKKYGDIFPEFRKRNFELIVKELLKIPFEKNRLMRARLGWVAYRHYLASRTGKLNLVDKVNGGSQAQK